LIVTGFAAAVLVGAGAAVAGTAVAGAAVAGAAVAGAATGTEVAGAEVAGATGVAAGAQAVTTNKAINARLTKVKSLRSIIFSFLINRTDLAIGTEKIFCLSLFFLIGDTSYVLNNSRSSVKIGIRKLSDSRRATRITNYQLRGQSNPSSFSFRIV
jgi:hypothetical protein